MRAAAQLRGEAGTQHRQAQGGDRGGQLRVRGDVAAASGVECHVDRKTIIKHRHHQRIMPKMVTVTAASKRLVGTAQLARRRRRSPPLALM